MKHNLTIKSDININDYFLLTKDDNLGVADYEISKDYNPTLPEIVAEEMVSQGLDPINSIDVIEFWRSKGIEV